MTKEQVQVLRAAGISELAIIDRILRENAAAGAQKTGTKTGDNSGSDVGTKTGDNSGSDVGTKTGDNSGSDAGTDTGGAAAPADRTDEILAAINKLTGAIQVRNQHGGRDEAASQSVDDILAGVLTPAGKKK